MGITILARTDGPAVAAWRNPITARAGTLCGVFSSGVGEGYAAVAFGFIDFGDATRNVEYVLYNTIDAIGADVSPYASLHDFATSLNFVQTLYVGASFVAADVQPIDKVAIVGAATHFFTGGAAVTGSAAGVSVRAGHAFFEDWNGPIHLAAQPALPGSAEVLVNAEPGDVRDFATDGTVLAWLQAYNPHADFTFDRLELWTAPVAFHASDLAPRLVTTRFGEGQNPGVVGGGWFADVQAVPLGLRFTALADGTRRLWAVPSDLLLHGGPIAVAAHDSLMPVVQRGGPALLVRVDPAAAPPE